MDGCEVILLSCLNCFPPQFSWLNILRCLRALHLVAENRDRKKARPATCPLQKEILLLILFLCQLVLLCPSPPTNVRFGVVVAKGKEIEERKDSLVVLKEACLAQGLEKRKWKNWCQITLSTWLLIHVSFPGP